MPQISALQTKFLSLATASPRTANTALRIFQTVTDTQLQLLAHDWTTEDIFWCRYFYIRLYANLESADNGHDAGLEQTAFQVIESPIPKCDPNWQLLEPIDSLARKIALEWRAHGA